MSQDIFDPANLDQPVPLFAGASYDLEPMQTHLNQTVERINHLSRLAKPNNAGGKGEVAGQKTVIALHENGTRVRLTVLTVGDPVNV